MNTSQIWGLVCLIAGVVGIVTFSILLIPGVSPLRLRTVPRRRVVITLSTIPSRLQYIEPVLQQLCALNIKPSKVYLFIPQESLREKKPYPAIEFPNLPPCFQLVKCEQDYGPLTKFYPVLALEPDPHTLIFTADDDQSYPAAAFDELYATMSKDDHAAWGYRGISRHHDTLKYHAQNTGPVDVLEGYAGVVYRRGFFQDDFQPATPGSPCFLTDDLWISGYLERKHIPRKMIWGQPYGQGGGLKAPIRHNRQVAALNPLELQNIQGGQNILCVKSLQPTSRGTSCGCSKK